MKGKSVGKLLVLSSLAVFSLLACNPDKGDSSKTGVPIYVIDSARRPSYTGANMEIKFFDDVGSNQIPYVKVLDYLGLFTDYYKCSYSGNVFTFTNTRWTSYNTARFDAEKNQLTYTDYATFVNANSTARKPLDLVCGDGIKKANIIYKTGTYTPGSQVTVNLNNYAIVPKVINNNLYLPMYTAKTLFINNNWPSLFYNGKYLFQDIPYEYSSIYTNTIKSTIFTPSKGYLEYAYNQFGLDVDFKYGMSGFKRTKRNTDEAFEYEYNLDNSSLNSTGIVGKNHNNFIKSPGDFAKQTLNVVQNYLDDGGHTIMVDQLNYYDSTELKSYGGAEYEYINDNFFKLAENRKNDTYGAYTALKEGYKVSGNTIFVTFDEFDFEPYQIKSAYGNQYFPAIQTILLNVHNAIKNSSINHLVLDLSQNGGGYVAAADMFCSYITRGASKTYVQSSIGGSSGYTQYTIDLDGDGEADSLPTDITSIDILCSKSTFSAANYSACTIANHYKDSNTTKVYIDGENSGGGQCCVDSTAVNALGMTVYMSGYQKLFCNTKEVDSGVTGLGISICSDMDWGLDPTKLTNYSNYSNYTNIKNIVQNH